ncbi:MAG: hypothetical protein KAT58_05295, partial [candidate division Zixibacteria bacterium]|nr:hypothetical protein [candidate division Zixibacteria bacterium]
EPTASTRSRVWKSQGGDVPKELGYDVSDESRNYVIPGMQHKYRETALAVISQDCHVTCDWCFRKRLFEGEDLEHDAIIDPAEALAYIREHSEIRSVLMTGGDALLAAPELVREMLDGIAEMKHIHNVRFGTRALVHDPYFYAARLPNHYCKTVYVVLHILRPEELREPLRDVVDSFPRYQFLVQTPLLRGINDDSQLLADLWHKCCEFRIKPYYVFQCRPVKGNEKYLLTFKEGHEIFAGAQNRCTGVVKPARYVMSSRSGKWEIVGRDSGEIILRCHQGADPNMAGTLRRVSANLHWWDLPRPHENPDS